MREITGKIFYTAQEVADMIGVHIQTVRLWIKRGKLKGVKIGRAFFINSDDVQKMMGIEQGGTTAQ
jgi:excisionase family DNA binding protein